MSASLFLVRNRFASSSRLVATTLRYSSTSASTPSADAPAVVKPADSAVATHEEQNNNIQAGVINGMPDELHIRQVRIYRPSAPSTQSAKISSHHWRLDWDPLSGGKWENPLMGWASSADYMQATHVKFNTKEDAIHFCEKQGYPFYIQEPKASKFKPKNYASNYTYTSKPIRLVTTK